MPNLRRLIAVCNNRLNLNWHLCNLRHLLGTLESLNTYSRMSSLVSLHSQPFLFRILLVSSSCTYTGQRLVVAGVLIWVDSHSSATGMHHCFVSRQCFAVQARDSDGPQVARDLGRQESPLAFPSALTYGIVSPGKTKVCFLPQKVSDVQR